MAANPASAHKVLMNLVLVPSMEELQLSRNQRLAAEGSVIQDLPDYIRSKIVANGEITKTQGNFDMKAFSVALLHRRNVLTLGDQLNPKSIRSYGRENIQSETFTKFADQFISENPETISDAEEIIGSEVSDFNGLVKVSELIDNRLVDAQKLSSTQLETLRAFSAEYLAQLHAGSRKLIDIKVSGFIQLINKIAILIENDRQDFENENTDSRICSFIFSKRLRLETMDGMRLRCHLKGPNHDTLLLNSSIIANKLVAIMMSSSTGDVEFKPEVSFQTLKATPLSISIYRIGAQDSRLFVDAYSGRELIQICTGRIKKCPLPVFLEQIGKHFDPEFSQYFAPSLPGDGVLEFTALLFGLSVVFIVTAVICDCVRRKREIIEENDESCQN